MRGIINQPSQINPRPARNPRPHFAFFSAPGTQSSAPGRKGEIRGSKRGGSPSVWGDSREVGGPLRYRFRVGFSTRKKLRLNHKHRPHQHLNSPPKIPCSPNTILRTLRTPDRSTSAPACSLLRASAPLRENPSSSPPSSNVLHSSNDPTLVILPSSAIGSWSFPSGHSAFCALKSAFPRAVGWWSVSSRLLVGHRSVSGRLVVGYRSVGGRLVVGLQRPTANPVSSFQSQAPDIQLNCAHFLHHSAPDTQSSGPRRNRVGSGSKTVGSMSVQGRLRDTSGSVLCRFGVGFFALQHSRPRTQTPPRQLVAFPATLSTSAKTKNCAASKPQKHLQLGPWDLAFCWPLGLGHSPPHRPSPNPPTWHPAPGPGPPPLRRPTLLADTSMGSLIDKFMRASCTVPQSRPSLSV